MYFVFRKIFRWHIILLILFLFNGILVQAQRTYNRLQYQDKEQWRFLPTALFHIYYPTEYDSLASFAALHLPDIMLELKQETGQQLRSIPNLIVYPSISKLYAAEIGITESQPKTFPTVSLTESRVLLAFNGSYQDFRKQIKKAIVRLIWEQNFEHQMQEQLSPSNTKIPEWFKDGALTYFAEKWPLAKEEILLQILQLQADSFGQYTALVKQYPELSGQAFCYFLDTRYRKDAVRQLYFQLRSGKSLSRAVRLVVKRELDFLTTECLTFYQNRNPKFFHKANTDIALADSFTLLLSKSIQGEIRRFLPAKDSRSYAVLSQKDNQRLLYVFPESIKNSIVHPTKRRNKALQLKPVLKYLMPPWFNSFESDQYPLVRYNPFHKGYDVVYPFKGQLKLVSFNAAGWKTGSFTLYGVDGVRDILPQSNHEWLLSAHRKSHVDLVLFDGRRLKYKVLSSGGQAEYDNLQSVNQTLYYRSGFPQDSLWHKDSLYKTYGIYKRAAQQSKSETLILADSLYYTWGIHSGAEELLYTGTIAGRTDTFNLGSAITAKVPLDGALNISSWLQDYYQQLKFKDSIKQILEKAGSGEASFLRAVLKPQADSTEGNMAMDSLRRSVAYGEQKTRNYVLQLHNAYFSARINNDYYINRLQPYAAYLGTFKFPEIGAMANGGFSDLFERHHVHIGYRMPAGSNGSDFFARYSNTAKRTDWHLLFFRKVERLNPGPYIAVWKDAQGRNYPTAANVKTQYYELGFHHPFDYYSGIRLNLSARRDKTVFLSTNRYSLEYPPLHALWSMVNVSPYINKCYQTLPMLYKGWEAKLIADGMLSTGQTKAILYGSQLSATLHQPVYKHITLVTQLQAGYSGGNTKILYNFGGIDNNIVPRVDTSIHFEQAAPYAFQSLVGALRGYHQNSAYGSSFVLANIDVYIPLFQELIPLKTRITSLKNLQINLFADVLQTGRVSVLAQQPQQLAAFGVGARTLLAGYPISFNLAWPGDFYKQSVWYLSLGLR